MNTLLSNVFFTIPIGDAEASWDGAAHTRYWKPLSKLLSSKSLLRLWVQFDYIICSALQRLRGFR